MDRYEYDVTESDGPIAIKDLNKKGAEGWKMCNVQWNNGMHIAHWIRKLPEQQKYNDNQVANAIENVTDILVKLNIPEKKITKICALTFIGLCKVVPDGMWSAVKRVDVGVSDIMQFIEENYNMKYKTGTRESFRREGINILLNHGIIDLNPSNSNLGPTSPLTHYAIKESVIEKLKDAQNQNK